MRGFLMAAAAAGAVMAATSAQAAMFGFTFAGTGISGAGTFTTTDTLVGGYYTITGITGSVTAGMAAPIAIASLDAPGSFEVNDNLLSPTDPFFDVFGVSFTLANAAATDVNIYYSTSSSAYRYYRTNANGNAVGPTALTSFTLTPVAAAVPEPASWAMMLGGFALAGMALRRRQTRTAVTFA